MSETVYDVSDGRLAMRLACIVARWEDFCYFVLRKARHGVRRMIYVPVSFEAQLETAIVVSDCER
jgi:hypothetical protein